MKAIVKSALVFLFLMLLSVNTLHGQIKVDANGYVGIHSPATIKGFLHVNAGSGSFATAPRIDISSSGTTITSLSTTLALYNNNLTIGNWNRLQFATTKSDGTEEDFAAVAVEYMNRTNGAQSGDLHLATVNCGTYASRFSIQSTSVANQVKYFFNTGSSAAGDGIYIYTTSSEPSIYPSVTKKGYLGTSANVWDYIFGYQILYTGTCAKYSDLRLKTNISNIGESSLEQILKLKGIKYQLKSELNDQAQSGLTPRVYLGFIAQDVKEVIPEVVTTDNQSGMYAIDYTSIIPVMVEAIKSQQKEIDSLKAVIADMQEKIKNLGDKK